MRRYAVGCLSRSLVASSEDYHRVKAVGGIPALAAALGVDDGPGAVLRCRRCG